MLRLRYRGAVLAFFCASAIAQVATAAAAPPTEYQLKAVFLFNFAQFVEWPEQAFETADAPLVICVLGQDPFGADLDEAVRGESAMGRPLLVRRHLDAADLSGCHILYVGSSGRGALEGIAARLQGHNTLVVSDIPQRGAMIGFVKERQRIRLRINLAAASEAGLTISSKLLRLADIVGPAGS